MKWPKREKKDEGENPCASCDPMAMGPEGKKMSQKEMIKKMREMEKNKAKSVDCPYLKTCDQKMLLIVGRMLCLDEEVRGRQGQVYMIHMSGHHMWENCKHYAELLREKKGFLPKQLKRARKKALKETK